MNSAPQRTIDSAELRDIERMAVELATIAGAEIITALGGMFAVRYKNRAAHEALWRDPVSEVDSRVETLIRARLAQRFPEHDIIGEEMDERPGRNHDFVWAVDPIDGTTNFVNGFPMFAASIGVLHCGRPIVGAVWCAASHALRAGVYHAAVDGVLRFDGSEVKPKANPAVRRRLAGVPQTADDDGIWETRKTGSAAIECAMVAAGLLQVARFAIPNIWDVAGGLALVAAAGAVARQHDGANWAPMRGFQPMDGPDGRLDLRHWRRAIVVGAADAVERMCARSDHRAPA
jgi:myo-inositol-1(or 4)-monophosphatase